MLNRNIVRRYGSASARTAGVAFTSSSRVWGQHVADRRQDPDRDDHRRQERLIDRAVRPFRLIRSGEARDEHTHPGEQRTDEDDDDEEDLPAHADGGVGREADEVARPARDR